ncbi:unnamed protein product [Urochloa humidicola]
MDPLNRRILDAKSHLVLFSSLCPEATSAVHCMPDGPVILAPSPKHPPPPPPPPPLHHNLPPVQRILLCSLLPPPYPPPPRRRHRLIASRPATSSSPSPPLPPPSSSSPWRKSSSPSLGVVAVTPPRDAPLHPGVPSRPCMSCTGAGAAEVDVP